MSDISLGSHSKFHQNDYLSALGMKRGVASPDIANVLATTSAGETATPPRQPEWVGAGAGHHRAASAEAGAIIFFARSPISPIALANFFIPGMLALTASDKPVLQFWK